MGKVVKEGSRAATKSVAEAVAGVNADSFSLAFFSKSYASVINHGNVLRNLLAYLYVYFL